MHPGDIGPQMGDASVVPGPCPVPERGAIARPFFLAQLMLSLLKAFANDRLQVSFHVSEFDAIEREPKERRFEGLISECGWRILR